MKILVTGGAGFIGSHIVDHLVKNKDQIRVLDNFSAGKLDNLRHNIGKIEIIRGDIRHIPTVKKAVKGVRYIIHEAALKSVPESLKRPEEFNDVNVTGTLNLLIAASRAKVKRLVMASSSSIYGDVKVLPQKETLIPAPISPYGATKAIDETYLKTFSRMKYLETVCLRYFNVFGPRQEPDSPYAGVIIKFINLMLKGKRPVIFGDGRQSRDFTYIDNVAKATIASLTAKGADGLSLNIASSQPITVIRLVESLNKILRTRLDSIFEPIRTGDIKHSYADISLARRYLAYKTIVPFEQGLIKTVNSFK